MEDIDDTRQEAFFVWCNHKGHDFEKADATDLVSSFEDEYQGEYDDEEDFAYQIVEECYKLPEFAKTYFDYAKFALIYFAATTGWRTVLYTVQLKISIRAGH